MRLLSSKRISSEYWSKLSGLRSGTNGASSLSTAATDSLSVSPKSIPIACKSVYTGAIVSAAMKGVTLAMIAASLVLLALGTGLASSVTIGTSLAISLGAVVSLAASVGVVGIA